MDGTKDFDWLGTINSGLGSDGKHICVLGLRLDLTHRSRRFIKLKAKHWSALKLTWRGPLRGAKVGHSSYYLRDR